MLLLGSAVTAHFVGLRSYLLFSARCIAGKGQASPTCNRAQQGNGPFCSRVWPNVVIEGNSLQTTKVRGFKDLVERLAQRIADCYFPRMSTFKLSTCDSSEFTFCSWSQGSRMLLETCSRLRTWIVQGHLEENSESGDWRLRLIYGGVELADKEWLRPPSAAFPGS